MQRMKVDAAAIGLKNRIGEQMIQVDQHRGNQNQVYYLPILLEEPVGDEKGKPEMQKVVYECFQRFSYRIIF